MTIKANPTKAKQPFAHAADLPAAYQELAKLLLRWKKRSPWPFAAQLPDAREVTHISVGALLLDANQIELTAIQLRDVALRIHAATHGERDARRYRAQLRKELQRHAAP